MDSDEITKCYHIFILVGLTGTENGQAVDLFYGVQNDIMVIWCTNNTGKGNTRFLAREGTATQVKFWLVKSQQMK